METPNFISRHYLLTTDETITQNVYESSQRIHHLLHTYIHINYAIVSHEQKTYLQTANGECFFASPIKKRIKQNANVFSKKKKI